MSKELAWVRILDRPAFIIIFARYEKVSQKAYVVMTYSPLRIDFFFFVFDVKQRDI